MKKNIFKIIAGTTLIALSGMSHAEREFADIYTECGLGAIENIEIDTAKGYGDYANTLANMYGCEGQQADELIDIMRLELKGIVSDQYYDSQSKYQRSEKFYNSLTPQAQALGCSA